MKHKRLLALLLATGLLLGAAACGNSGGGQTGDSSKPAGTEKPDTDDPTDAPDQTEDDTKDNGPLAGVQKLAGYDDPIEFSVFIRDPNMAPADNNPVIKTIEEMTGVKLKYEFLVGDLNQKLGVMIAGGEYPDAIFAGDQSSSLMEAGAFIPLDDEIPKYENLNKLYGSVMGYMQAADGHIYTMDMYAGSISPGTTKAAPIFQSGIGFFIQKAVLEDAGYPVPRSVEEYFKLIEDYKAKYPEIDGVKTVGFEILADGWRNWALVNPTQNLLGASNDGALFVDPDTLETSFYQASDLAKSYYKELNNAYHKGLIEAETFTQNYDQYLAKLSTGAVLGFYDQTWNSDAGTNLLKNDGKYERTYIAVPIAGPDAKDAYIDAPSGLPGTVNGIGITVNCENPDRLLAFYDWLLQREVQDYLQWGEEGTDWVYNADQTGKLLTESRRAIMNDVAQTRDLTGKTLWNYAPKWQGIYEVDNMPCGPEESPDEYLASLSEYDQNFLEAYGYQYPAEMLSEPVLRPAYYPIWAMTLEDGSAAAVSNTKITDVMVKYYPQLILAEDDAKYEEIWTQFSDEFNSIDLDAYKSEIDRQIEEKMANDAAIKAESGN